MTQDERWARYDEHMHRVIGQLARDAHEDVRERAQWQRMRMEQRFRDLRELRRRMPWSWSLSDEDVRIAAFLLGLTVSR